MSFVPPLLRLQYASVGHVIQEALGAYHRDVVAGEFPSQQYSPYK
mgnify:CR=1 FL=1